MIFLSQFDNGFGWQSPVLCVALLCYCCQRHLYGVPRKIRIQLLPFIEEYAKLEGECSGTFISIFYGSINCMRCQSLCISRVDFSCRSICNLYLEGSNNTSLASYIQQNYLFAKYYSILIITARGIFVLEAHMLARHGAKLVGIVINSQRALNFLHWATSQILVSHFLKFLYSVV